MCVCIYALEELYPYHNNGFIWDFTSSFANPQIILIRFIFWNWNGINSVKYTILALPNIDT